MSLIARRSSLILDSVARENPALPLIPTISNCWVYHYRHEDDLNGWCYIRGRAGSGLSGKKLVRYQKLDLETLFIGCTLSVSRIDSTTVAGYLGQINTQFGLDLEPGDIINHSVGSTATTLDLEMLINHPLYRGKVTFSIGTHAERLGTVVTARELEVIVDINDAWYAMPSAILTYGHDYSEIASYLSTLYSDYLVTDTRVIPLVNALRSVDRIPWGIVENTLLSLVGAKVVYSGKTSDTNLDIVRSDYSHVVAIQPVSNELTTFGKTLLLFHYNTYDAVRS